MRLFKSRKFPFKLGDYVTYKDSGGHAPMEIISYKPFACNNWFVHDYIVRLKDEDGFTHSQDSAKLKKVEVTKRIFRDFSHLTMDEIDAMDQSVKCRSGIICAPITLKVGVNTKELER